MTTLVFFLEELSARALLEGLLPRVIGAEVAVRYVVFEGKQDLERLWETIEAGMAALRWLSEGYGYDIIALDLLSAYTHTIKAAEISGCADDTRRRIHALVSKETSGNRLLTKVLGQALEMS